MNIIGYANREDSEKGWDGMYLDRFIEWAEDNGVIADEYMTEDNYNSLRREYDSSE